MNRHHKCLRLLRLIVPRLKKKRPTKIPKRPRLPSHRRARSPPGAKPYNIQIEAVMDRSGADEMVSRLKSLGYNAQEVKVALNGQTWYRVRIGPYASADEATAAQNQLREQYKQAYTTSHWTKFISSTLKSP